MLNLQRVGSTALFVTTSRTVATVVGWSMAKFMPAYAQRLLSFQCRRTNPPQVVSLWRDYFKVFRINASSIPAQMVKLHPFWDRATHQFPGQAMCIEEVGATLTTPTKKDAVANAIRATRPKPARWCLIDLRPKALLGWFFDWAFHAISLPCRTTVCLGAAR